MTMAPAASLALSMVFFNKIDVLEGVDESKLGAALLQQIKARASHRTIMSPEVASMLFSPPSAPMPPLESSGGSYSGSDSNSDSGTRSYSESGSDRDSGTRGQHHRDAAEDGDRSSKRHSSRGGKGKKKRHKKRRKEAVDPMRLGKFPQASPRPSGAE